MPDETPMREILRAVDASMAQTNANGTDPYAQRNIAPQSIPDQYGKKAPRPDPDYIYGICARIVRLNFSEITEELGAPIYEAVATKDPPRDGDAMARILFNFAKDWLEKNEQK